MGRTTTKNIFHPSHGVLKDTLDTGQIEDGFSNSKSIKGYRGSYTLPDPEQHESSYKIYLLNVILGRNFCNFHTSGRKASELIAKTKGSDRSFTINLGLSQSLMVHKGTHNTNVTLKGYPKKFWSLFGQEGHKTQQITLSQPPKGRFILNPNKLQTDLQP